MSNHHPGGRPELGQNFLVDRAVIAAIVGIVDETTGPIVELGSGAGAVTKPLGRSGRPITAVEIDPKNARRLDRATPDHVTVHNADVLRFPFPSHPYVLVGNLPFHITTPVLRRILAARHWHTSVLLLQWEVARRRAGVGGATMMTASWWPWYEFSLHSRVPAMSFRPVPSVDAGLLRITRRPSPLVNGGADYQRFVKRVFTGRGRGLAEILARTGLIDRHSLRRWLRQEGVAGNALAKDLTADQWASLWRIIANDFRSAEQENPKGIRSSRG